MTALNHLLLHCRPGFEGETAAEITQRAAEQGVYGYAKTEQGSGWVDFVCQQPNSAALLVERVPFRSLIFARQWFASSGPVDGLSSKDRLMPLLPVLRAFPQCGELSVECADSATADSLVALCRKLTSPAAALLRKQGLLSQKRNRKQPTLHLFLSQGDCIWPGISYPNNASLYVRGIPRLRFPPSAPSRSTLKLEEAFHHFLSPSAQRKHLQPGMRAVDLGAAPGGWTWQLVQRSLRVAAVDNGPMQPALMESGLVEHVREDGFRFQPAKPVHWMVCDMVDIPIKVSECMANWYAEGWCERAIFNLKLPMKKRYQAVEDCLSRLHERLLASGRDYRIDARQLYHDREEITLYLRPPE